MYQERTDGRGLKNGSDGAADSLRDPTQCEDDMRATDVYSAAAIV